MNMERSLIGYALEWFDLNWCVDETEGEKWWWRWYVSVNGVTSRTAIAWSGTWIEEQNGTNRMFVCSYDDSNDNDDDVDEMWWRWKVRMDERVLPGNNSRIFFSSLPFQIVHIRLESTGRTKRRRNGRRVKQVMIPWVQHPGSQSKCCVSALFLFHRILPLHPLQESFEQETWTRRKGPKSPNYYESKEHLAPPPSKSCSSFHSPAEHGSQK